MQRQQAQGRTRAGLFLVGSLLLALLAAGLVFKIVQKNREQLREAQKPKETVDVVIAQRDLYMGLPIGEDDVVVRQMVPGMVPEEGTFATLADVLGRTPRERVLSNEPLREERLARPDAGIGLNAIVTPGKRAMTVQTNTEDAVAGLLQPGNYVDIIVTIKPEDPTAAGAKWATDTILQGIKVLAVGGTLNPRANEPAPAQAASNKPADAKAQQQKKATKDPQAEQMRRMKPSITLEVTPEEAEKLALAVAQGDIHVVLRSDIDILQYADNGPITSKTLIGFPTAAPPATPGAVRRGPATPETPTTPSAEVIQGSEKTDVKFNPDGTSTETTDKRKRNR